MHKNTENFKVPEMPKIDVFGYAENSSNSIFTTKGTKDTKREGSINLSFLRALRVLRGEITLHRIQLELFG